MNYTDKLGLPVWNKPETDVFDIEQFNEGMKAIDDIVIHILNQINDLTIGDTKIDLNEYVKEKVFEELKKKVENKADKDHEHTEYLTEIPGEYVTDTELSSKGYATETFVTNKIAEASLSGGDVDLSGYATKEEVETINSQLDTNANKFNKYSPYKINYKLKQIQNLIELAYFNNTDVTLVIVGDSIRASNGQGVYKTIKKRMRELGVNVKLSAQSGLKAEHWSKTNVHQENFITVDDTIALIPGDGTNCIVDISLGLNDQTATSEQLKTYIVNGINKILNDKPNCLINVTSVHFLPNEMHSLTNKKIEETYEELRKTNKYGCIDMQKSVFNNIDTDEIYMISSGNIHPNIDGQELIANVYLKHFINEKIKDKKKVIQYQGYSNNGYIRGELKLSLGSLSGLYVQISSDGNTVQLFQNSEAANAITSAYNINNDNYITIEQASWVSSSLKFECRLYIDLNKIDELKGTRVKINNYNVTEFTKWINEENLLKKNIANNNNILIYKGFAVDFNYTCQVEIKGNNDIKTLYLRKTGTNYAFYESSTGGNSISPNLIIKEGKNEFNNSSWSTKKFSGLFYIPKIDEINKMTDGEYIEFKNFNVNELSQEKSLEEHLKYLYKLL